MLVAIAHALRSQSRATDTIGRFGGDEFVAILPGTVEPGAREAAARMVQSVRHIPFNDRGLSVSVGAACLAPEIGAEELLQRADRDMYACKRLAAHRVPRSRRGSVATFPA